MRDTVSGLSFTGGGGRLGKRMEAISSSEDAEDGGRGLRRRMASLRWVFFSMVA